MSLQEADYGSTEMAMKNQSRFAADDTLLVRFYTHPRRHPTKSEAAGRPIFEETPYIQIMQPGNKDSIIIRPVTEIDRNRFPEHYRKFMAREDQDHIEGTLLEEWPAVTRSQVEELRYLNIRTVEQLASVSDVNSQNVMGIQILKSKAEKYLEAASSNATADALDAANARIDELMAMVKESSAPAVEVVVPETATAALASIEETETEEPKKGRRKRTKE
jgi:hypothetical protein